MRHRKEKNLYGYRVKSRWLLLVFLLSAPFAPVLGAESKAVTNSYEQMQQKRTITGTVMDKNGEPIIGANVVIEKTTIGTITDFDGKFSLGNVPDKAKLVVSFIGYNPKVVVVSGTNLNIVLDEDTQVLGEVEVVAYGTQKKVSVTGSLASVGGKELAKTPTGSISNMLTGQMAGLTTVQYSGEPGSDAASIFVRGKATFNDSAPLIQVDGVERDFNSIDPNEIESISILKDASATAVFGVRGANGVVLITTKRGAEGKAKISFSTSASIIAPTKPLEMASSYEYATFYNQMQRNDGVENVMFTDAVVQKFKDGSDPIRFPSTDWISYCLKDATLQTQHNVNISGGTKSVRYFISAGAYTQGGLFDNFGLPYSVDYSYKRFNYRSNLDIDVTKTTTLSMNVAGSVDDANKPYTGQGSAGMLINMYYSTPFSSPGLVNGHLIALTDEPYADNPDLRLPFVGGAGMSYYGVGYMQSSNNKLTSDVKLEQKLDFITKGLKFHIKGSYNSSFSAQTQATHSLASYTPVVSTDDQGNIIYDANGQPQLVYRKNGNDKEVTFDSAREPGKARDWYMEAAFNWSRTFGDHAVTALALYNQSKEYYPGSYSDIPRGLVGFAGRTTYSYKNRYLAEFNIGYNGSENFAEGKRFGTFPSGSFGYIISEEKFFKPLKPLISFMKLRYSIGLVGNDRGVTRFMYTADPYYTNDTGLLPRDGNGYVFGINNGTVSPGAFEDGKNNPDVTWEKALKNNYGVDMNFFDDHLSTSFDYFTEDRKDILLSDGTAPGILGFNLPTANLGRVKSWGWELSLKWNDKIGSDFRYNVGVNLMYNQNKIVENKESPKDFEYMSLKNRRIGVRSQYQFFEYYNSETTPQRYKDVYGAEMPVQLAGENLKNGDCVYVDLSGDGIISDSDMSRDLGFTDDPEYMAGVNLGFSWKGFDVSMLWAGAWNVTRQISNVFQRPFTNRQTINDGGLLKFHTTNTWTNENPDPNAEFPRATFENGNNNYQSSTLWEKDSKYLRLKNLQVAYNFNFPFMKKLKLNTCQLSLTGYNLLTFTPYVFGDPESRASNSPSYPLTKTYSLSLKLGF